MPTAAARLAAYRLVLSLVLIAVTSAVAVARADAAAPGSWIGLGGGQFVGLSGRDPAIDAEARRQVEAARARQRERNSAEARQRRARRRFAFGGRSRAEALAILRSRFAEVSDARLWSGLRLPPGQRVAGYIDDFHAQITTGPSPDDRAVVASTLALRNQDGRPVDLEIEQRGGGYIPAEPIVETEFPDELADGVALDGGALRIRPTSDRPTDAQVVEGKVFYANAQTDTDVLIAPTAVGIETFTQLRSAASPEDPSFELHVPGGAELRLVGAPGASAADGTIEVVKDGEVVASAGVVRAWDADQTPVPVTYELDGTRVIMRVRHRSMDVAYPVMVDPDWRMVDFQRWATGAPGWNFGYSGGCEGWGGFFGQGFWNYGLIVVSAGERTCPNGELGQWWWRAPNASYIWRTEYSYVTHLAERSTCISEGHWGYTLGWQNPWLWCAALNNNWHVVCTVPSCDPNVGEESNYTIFRLWLWGTVYRQYGPYAELGGAAVFLGDRQPPVVDRAASNQPTGWVRTGRFAVEPLAHDDGIGMKSFRLYLPGYSLPFMERDTGCLPNCARSLGWPEAHPPELDAFGYDVDRFPDGINTLEVRAFDALGKQDARSFDVKVDARKPDVALSGALEALDGEKYDVSEVASLDLTAAATDGVAGGPNSLRRSGVQVVDIDMLAWNPDSNGGWEFRRLVRKERDAGCVDSCPVTSTFTYDPNVDGIGKRMFRVWATDAAGNGYPDPITVTVTFKREKLKSTLQQEGAFSSSDFGGADTIVEPAARTELAAEENMGLARSLGVGGVRMFANWGEMTRRGSGDFGDADPDLDPRDCDPPTIPQTQLESPESYNFARLDRIVNNARANGLGITLTFRGAVPCWAIATEADRATCAPRPSEDCYNQPDLRYYSAWVTAVKARYGPVINRWSPWNEPNLKSNLDYPDGQPYSAAHHYRRMYFAARAVLGADAAFLFGDVSSRGTPPPQFLYAAACSPTYAPLPCPADAPAGLIDAVELAFHDYIGGSGGTPADNAHRIDMMRNVLFYVGHPYGGGTCCVTDRLKWIAHTEGGVNAYKSSTGLLDPEPKQARYLNCMEENLWREPKNTRFGQYLLQDPIVGHLDTTFSGLRNSAPAGKRGIEKESYRAFQAPLTVKRTSNAIHVWGAWRPATSPAPTAISLVASSPGRVAAHTIELNGGHYFDERLKLSFTPSGSSYRIEGPTAVSRYAFEDDCAQP